MWWDFVVGWSIQLVFKKSVRCRRNWKVLQADKSSENIEKFYIQTIFPIWWSKISTPYLSFAVIYFQIFFLQFDANETGKCWKQTKIVKISIKRMFKPVFDMMEQKIDPKKWVKVAEQWKKIVADGDCPLWAVWWCLVWHRNWLKRWFR